MIKGQQMAEMVINAESEWLKDNRSFSEKKEIGKDQILWANKQNRILGQQEIACG